MHIKRFVAIVMLSALMISCENDTDNLKREILTTNLWLNERENDNGVTESFLVNFSEGGIVSSYSLSCDKPEAESELRYIYDPEEELLTIESIGPLEVSEITVDKLKLSSKKKEVTLKRYHGDISLP